MNIKKLEACMRRYDLGDLCIQTTAREISIICKENRGRYATVKKRPWRSPTSTLCSAIELYMKLEKGLDAINASNENADRLLA